MGLLRLGSGGGLVLSLIFNIVALATPAWIVSGNSSIGLFKIETSFGTLDVEKTEAEKVAIAFNILAMVTVLCAAGLVLLAGKDDDKDQMGKIGGGLAIIAALFMLIEMATYTGLYKVGSSATITWGYSYALGWVAFCLALIGGIVALVGK